MKDDAARRRTIGAQRRRGRRQTRIAAAGAAPASASLSGVPGGPDSGGRFVDWLQRFLQHNSQIVQEIHRPTANLACESCDQPWPCPPYSAATTEFRTAAKPTPSVSIARREQIPAAEDSP